MICFLTSNPFSENGALNPANGFVDALKASLPAGAVRGLFVASSPDEPDTNDHYAAEQKAAGRGFGFHHTHRRPRAHPEPLFPGYRPEGASGRL